MDMGETSKPGKASVWIWMTGPADMGRDELTKYSGRQRSSAPHRTAPHRVASHRSECKWNKGAAMTRWVAGRLGSGSRVSRGCSIELAVRGW